MIIFYGKMYNYTDGEFIDNSPTLYSLAQYIGTSISANDDGTTRTDIPFTEFSIDAGTNIGLHFEFYAKEYFENNGIWPVLRLCTTNDPEDYYLEWVHDDPTGFNIKAPGIYMRWASCFQWIDTYTAPYFNSVRSYIFSSAATKEDLAQQVIAWTGAVRNNQDLEVVETLISYSTFQISAPANCLINNAGAYLGSISDRIFYKTYDGPMIAVFQLDGVNGWTGPISFCPAYNGEDMPPYNGCFTHNDSISSIQEYITENNAVIQFTARYQYHLQFPSVYDDGGLPTYSNEWTVGQPLNDLFNLLGVQISYIRTGLYDYLQGEFGPEPTEPDSDVDPDDIPPADEPPTPIDPDNPDPYYDPTSDPVNPDYDPTKDPDSPDYDPDVPHTPFRPISGDSPIPDPDPLPPVDDIVVPPAPPAYVTNKRLLTFYNPVDSELNDLATFLWSPTWSVDTFKKIFANPLDAILGLMVMPTVPATVSTRELTIGNIGTGITMRYFTQQFVDVPCGSIDIKEYYQSYLDYSPYTKVMLILPFIGECAINTDEVMNKTLSITYRFDIATGICVAFVSVDGNVLYTFNGSAVTSIPLSANGWGSAIGGLLSMPIKALGFGAATGTGPVGTLGAAAAISVASMKPDISHTGNITGSAGLMGIQKPYVIINRPRQALPMNQNSYTGYPSFITESLGGLKGYTEVEKCHLEHVPATAEELNEIERLLKEGVLL